jgi:hypothetical protein
VLNFCDLPSSTLGGRPGMARDFFLALYLSGSCFRLEARPFDDDAKGSFTGSHQGTAAKGF